MTPNWISQNHLTDFVVGTADGVQEIVRGDAIDCVLLVVHGGGRQPERSAN